MNVSYGQAGAIKSIEIPELGLDTKCILNVLMPVYLFIFPLIYYLFSRGGATRATASMWRSEDILQKLVLFFHNMCPEMESDCQACPQVPHSPSLHVTLIPVYTSLLGCFVFFFFF